MAYTVGRVVRRDRRRIAPRKFDFLSRQTKNIEIGIRSSPAGFGLVFRAAKYGSDEPE